MIRRTNHVRSRPALIGGLAAESVKLWTLLSNRILAVVVLIIIAGSGGLLSASLLSRLIDSRFAGQTIEASPLQFVDSVLWAQIIVAVIGVLAVAGEYTSGQIRLSLLALPTRLPWLASKTLVLAATGFVIGVLGTTISLGLSVMILSGTEVVYTVEFGEAATLCLRSGLYLATIAALAVGLTAVLRNVVAGLTVVLGLLVVVPPVLSSIPGIGWLADYTPTFAGRRLISDFDSLAQLSPWGGYGVLALWAAAMLIVAGVLLIARDA
ncbi:hypothetical protein CW368_11900 [Actinomycetales bacterium SN12]|nr:hypothetical protein CW368_11900 [Actinomycetales bacterium SN12]